MQGNCSTLYHLVVAIVNFLFTNHGLQRIEGMLPQLPEKPVGVPAQGTVQQRIQQRTVLPIP